MSHLNCISTTKTCMRSYYDCFFILLKQHTVEHLSRDLEDLVHVSYVLYVIRLCPFNL